jgi:multidrug resistance efflux pump
MTMQPVGLTPEAPKGHSEPVDSGLRTHQFTNGLLTESDNKSCRRAHSHLPAARRVGLSFKLLLIAAAVGLMLTGGAGGWYWLHPLDVDRVDIITAPARKGKLAITVKERGILESAQNNDVLCRVKARTQNATVATTIKWVIDDGSPVKKDDLLLEFDDSGLVEGLKTQNIAVDQARAAWITAQEQYKIQLSQNDSDIQTKRTALELASIDLEKYHMGDFPQSLKDVEGRIKVAESDLEQQRDRAAWAQRMLKKGYYTISQSDAEQSKLQSNELSLAKVAEEKRVLVDPIYGLQKRTETDLKNKLGLAKDDLDRAQAQARAKEVTARSDRDTKKLVLDQETAKQRDLQEEIKKCKVYAPQDGLVVYFIPEQARYGMGSQQSTVAQGESVREGQKLMQIPDLKHMLVNTRVHEALVTNLRGEVRNDNGNIVFRGQEARVRIDAYPDRELKAHVKTVATVAAQGDRMSADVKLYVTMIAIDESLDGLKPGMSAEVAILVDTTLDDVLIVPAQAIMGTSSMGKKRYCWARTGTGFEQREIEVGANNEKEIEIRSGLKESEQVVLNYQVLEDDRIKSRRPSLAERNHDESADLGNGPSPASEVQKAEKGKTRPSGKKGREKGAGVKAKGNGNGVPSGSSMNPEQ